jgi:hypothetical protein
MADHRKSFKPSDAKPPPPPKNKGRAAAHARARAQLLRELPLPRDKKRDAAKRATALAASAAKSNVQKAPVATGRIMGTTAPKITSGRRREDGRQMIRVVHTEFIKDILPATVNNSDPRIPYSIEGFLINPANTALFKWLPNVAANYEEFRFDRLAFHYETTAGTSTIGTVGAYIDFNPSQALANGKSQALQMTGARRAVPWEKWSLTPTPPQLNAIQQWRFVRDLSVLGATPFGDCGLVAFFTDGFANLSVGASYEPPSPGELYVSYAIEFILPETETYALADNSSYGLSANTTGVADCRDNPFGDGANSTILTTSISNSTLPITNPLNPLTGLRDQSLLQFHEAGEYLLTVFATSAAAVAVAAGIWITEISNRATAQISGALTIFAQNGASAILQVIHIYIKESGAILRFRVANDVAMPDLGFKMRMAKYTNPPLGPLPTISVANYRLTQAPYIEKQIMLSPDIENCHLRMDDVRCHLPIPEDCQLDKDPYTLTSPIVTNRPDRAPDPALLKRSSGGGWLG